MAQMRGSFSEPLTRMGALYFTVTVFATVGFGDISPVTDGARAAVTAQMVLNAVFIGLLVKVIFGAAQASLRRDDPALESDDSQGPGAPDRLALASDPGRSTGPARDYWPGSAASMRPDVIASVKAA